MSVLIEIDQIRSYLSAPGQPFELVEQTIEGVPLTVYKNLPSNLSHLIAEAERFGDRTFLVSGERRLSYAETLGQAAALAAWLRDVHGVGLGQRVAIASRNSPEWIIAFLAIQLTGATASLVNSRGTADEIVHAVHDTECGLVIADTKRAEALAGRFAGSVVVADSDGGFRGPDGGSIDLSPAPVEPSAAVHGDPAIIMFTSGTTGRPKGAVLNHRGVGTFLFGMRHNGAAYLAQAAKRMGVEPQALIANMPQMATLAIFPLFHVSGASAMLMGALINGGKIVMVDRWNPAEALWLIARERITMFQGPPSIFWDVLNCPEFAGADVSSVTNIGIGGQATPPHLLELLLKRFPKAAPGGGFGQTETNGAIASGTGAEYLANPKGSGRVLPGTEVRIVDEHGSDLPLGEVGEIWVRSPLNMAGYWNQPEANAAVFADGGWLKTGDVGCLDQDRFITVVDRKKDVVICGGENIYCAELERVFQEFPGVLEVAAFGVADDRLGERVVLAVVPLAGQTLSAEDMLGFGRTRLAGYKIPSEIVFTATPFARNTVGKIDKPALRRGYASQHI
jgi:acyl-CoA synthetase (AMP-forming)/AMP-acid ligase II